MINYLGETLVTDLDASPFRGYKKSDWCLYFISQYGQIDGNHHKLWLLDQLARIIHGTKPVIHLAKWANGESEYRVQLDAPSQQYEDWVLQMKGDGEYDYDIGSPP